MNIASEVRAWLDENVIGARPIDDNLKAMTEDYVVEMIANRVDCDPEDVTLTNPRWEGNTFVADGFTYPLQMIHINFTIDEDTPRHSGDPHNCPFAIGKPRYCQSCDQMVCSNCGRHLYGYRHPERICRYCAGEAE